MMKRFLAIGLGVGLILSLGLNACKKNEQTSIPTAPQMAPGTQMLPGQGQMPPGMNITKTELKVVVPDSVKGKWSGVKLLLEDKATKKTTEFTVSLNSELKVPDSDLKVAVGDFLPDFRMDQGTITSASNDPNNPAVGVKVYEGDKQIFKGWLYAKFPTIHPFEHPKYGLTMKEAIKKG
ncbi:MAG TPA: DUF2155 domain-containing protein [Nitrospiraceae bacterium]|nr:DUF2155 domain-containing protein [Nitrospiraceae bacterium]